MAEVRAHPKLWLVGLAHVMPCLHCIIHLVYLMLPGAQPLESVHTEYDTAHSTQQPYCTG